ncbi:hypothetical protein CP981_04615 [Streptomyces platensis]|uniref:Uncharacterized protein n=1 Tax=Streptomyces platensis TaxID=58346 RepID=A0AAE6NDT7_STRPT|nr:hypothetical protein CP981_04615 [Streptomyces platensis]
MKSRRRDEAVAVVVVQKLAQEVLAPGCAVRGRPLREIVGADDLDTSLTGARRQSSEIDLTDVRGPAKCGSRGRGRRAQPLYSSGRRSLR